MQYIIFVKTETQKVQHWPCLCMNAKPFITWIVTFLTVDSGNSFPLAINTDVQHYVSTSAVLWWITWTKVIWRPQKLHSKSDSSRSCVRMWHWQSDVSHKIMHHHHSQLTKFLINNRNTSLLKFNQLFTGPYTTYSQIYLFKSTQKLFKLMMLVF